MKFKKAPIAEVVIGTQFEGIVLDNPFIYEYHQKVKDSFPTIKDNPILPSIIEKIDGRSEVKLLQGFHSRKFLINPNDTKLIQLQPDKLLFNWKRTSDEQQYPHFTTVFDEFISAYNHLNKKCDLDNKLNQLEVTYLDHINMADFGRDDYNPSDIISFLNLDSKKIVNHLNHKFISPVKELNGNIHLEIKSAISNIDKSKILVVESTCRGALLKQNLKEWFDLAHIELLKLFDEITTDNAKNVWEIVS